jgi:hypothetical protein
MKTFLKIKLKELAAEGQANRLEQIRWGRKIAKLRAKHGQAARTFNAESMVNALSEHKRRVIRVEARHSHLAYGFLRGRRYIEMERLADKPPNWEKVLDEATRFGAFYFKGDKRALAQRFAEWQDEGKAASDSVRAYWDATKDERAAEHRQKKDEAKSRYLASLTMPTEGDEVNR